MARFMYGYERKCGKQNSSRTIFINNDIKFREQHFTTFSFCSLLDCEFNRCVLVAISVFLSPTFTIICLNKQLTFMVDGTLSRDTYFNQRQLLKREIPITRFSRESRSIERDRKTESHDLSNTIFFLDFCFDPYSLHSFAQESKPNTVAYQIY